MKIITDMLMAAGSNLLFLLLFAAVGVSLIAVFQLVYNLLTPYDDKQEIQRGNMAAAITRGGAYLGILVAASGSLIGSPEPSLWVELGMFALDGVVAVIVFTLLFKPMDWFVLQAVINSREIKYGNTAVAWVEFALYAGQGIIMSAAFSGEGQGLVHGLLSAVLFSVLGQLILGATYWLFVVGHRLEKVTRDLNQVPCPPTRRNIEAEISAGHMRPAIDVALTILAVSITLWFSISGDFTSWANDIVSYLVAAVASVIAVTATREGVERLLARLGYGHNEATAFLVGLITVGVGLTVGLVTFLN